MRLCLTGALAMPWGQELTGEQCSCSVTLAEEYMLPDTPSPVLMFRTKHSCSFACILLGGKSAARMGNSWVLMNRAVSCVFVKIQLVNPCIAKCSYVDLEHSASRL